MGSKEEIWLEVTSQGCASNPYVAGPCWRSATKLVGKDENDPNILKVTEAMTCESSSSPSSRPCGKQPQSFIKTFRLATKENKIIFD